MAAAEPRSPSAHTRRSPGRARLRSWASGALGTAARSPGLKLLNGRLQIFLILGPESLKHES